MLDSRELLKEIEKTTGNLLAKVETVLDVEWDVNNHEKLVLQQVKKLLHVIAYLTYSVRGE